MNTSNAMQYVTNLMFKTRWTFFRVKLVFECDIEISWSFGPWVLGMLWPFNLGPWDSWTSGLWDLFPPPLPPHNLFLLLLPTSSSTLLPPSISSYLHLSLPTSFYLLLPHTWFGLVWCGMVWYGEVELWHWDWRWTFDINIDVRKFMGGLVGGGCIWIIASALVLFLSFDIWAWYFRFIRTRAWQQFVKTIKENTFSQLTIFQIVVTFVIRELS